MLNPEILVLDEPVSVPRLSIQAPLSATLIADPVKKRERVQLEGELPSLLNIPSGCAFHPRCQIAIAQCSDAIPDNRTVAGRVVACIRAD